MNWLGRRFEGWKTESGSRVNREPWWAAQRRRGETLVDDAQLAQAGCFVYKVKRDARLGPERWEGEAEIARGAWGYECTRLIHASARQHELDGNIGVAAHGAEAGAGRLEAPGADGLECRGIKQFEAGGVGDERA